MNDNTWVTRLTIVRAMLLGTLVLMGVMAYKVAEPYLSGSQYTAPAETKLELPAYDTKAWAEWPVLEDGRVAEEGNHQELLRKAGLYARFWARQSGGFIGLDEAAE